MCVYNSHKPALCATFSLFHLIQSNTVSWCSLTKDSITVQLHSQVGQMFSFWNAISLFKRSTEEIESLLFHGGFFFFVIPLLLWPRIPNYPKCCFIIVSDAEMKCRLAGSISPLHVHYGWSSTAWNFNEWPELFLVTLWLICLYHLSPTLKNYKSMHNTDRAGDERHDAASPITCHDWWGRRSQSIPQYMKESNREFLLSCLYSLHLFDYRCAINEPNANDSKLPLNKGLLYAILFRWRCKNVSGWTGEICYTCWLSVTKGVPTGQIKRAIGCGPKAERGGGGG